MQLFTRKKQELKGPWYFQIDPMRVVTSANLSQFFSKHPADITPKNWEKPHNWSLGGMEKIKVPGVWGALKGFENYEGTAIYCCRFSAGSAARKSNVRSFLHFEGVLNQCEVFLNEVKAGANIAAYAPFSVEVTGKLKAKNTLLVRVDNTRSNYNIPPFKFDWLNCGGIHQPVSLVTVPKTFISDVRVVTKSINNNTIRAEVKVQLDGAGGKRSVNVEIPEVGFKAVLPIGANGMGSKVFVIEAKPWTTEKPVLYKLRVKCGKDIFEDGIGFRTIEVKGTDILLNDRPVWLRGISCHGESPKRSDRSVSKADAEALLKLAKELNCNFVRMAHYPHTEWMARTADRLGLMLWAEIPIFHDPIFSAKSVITQSTEMLTALIKRDINRPSIIIWSVGNETPWIKKPSRNKLMGGLIDLARRMDPSRLLTFAGMGCDLPQRKGYRMRDVLYRKTDFTSWNEYVGWYDRRIEQLDDVLFTTDFKKPMIISETGAEAVRGSRGPKNRRWTEDNQAYYYAAKIRMFERHNFIKGATPWILMDFKSQLRHNETQLGYNRKGLVDKDLRKKLAFGVLQKYYGKKALEYGEKPFVSC
ncbi:MAG: hypothetical protein NTX32_04780 [Candidatus Firestonebacteria bacterium]|nr:hypothetical protein [Candidatus Firestonebacteria bacterium]